MDATTVSKSVGSVLRHLLVYAVLWVALVRGQVVESWYLGVPAVIAASYMSWRITAIKESRVRLIGLVRFLPLFWWRSLLGGIDVALRALRPSLPIRPDLLIYELRLEPDSMATRFFAEVISLLPGTLCTQLLPDSLEVHVIDRDMPVAQELAVIEEAVARVFGASIGPRLGNQIGNQSGNQPGNQSAPEEET